MAADSPIAREVQSISAKAAAPDVSPALDEVRADWAKHASSHADLQEFSQRLQQSGALPRLALEYGKEALAGAQADAVDLPTIKQLQATAATKHDDLSSMMFGQLATDFDKNKAPDSGKLTAAQIDVDLKGATAGADAGQTPTAAAAAAAAPQEAAFTRPIAAKEGPYQPIAAAHPDWKPHQVLDAAHKVKAALGQDHVYRQGEQLRMNDDGTVTSRINDRHTPGNFDDTTMKDGKKASERTGDAKGNWVNTTFGDDGKPTGSTEHVQKDDGTYTDTNKGADGKRVSEQTGDSKGNFTKTTFGADDKPTGSTEHVQNADGSFTETNKGADGKPTGTLEHKVNADGTSDDTTKGADGSVTQTLHTNADKSTVKTVSDPAHPGNFTETKAGPDGTVTGTAEVVKNADNSTDRTEKGTDGSVAQVIHTNADNSTVTTVNHADKPGSYTETHAAADGTVTSTVEFTKNADNSTDRVENGADGKPTKSVHTNPDGSTATVDYKDGQPAKESDVAADKSHTDKTFAPSANIKFISVSFSPDGENVGNEQVNNDGSSHKWTVDAQGQSVTTDVENGVQTTKTTDKDNKPVSTVIVTHENGKTVTVTQIPGQADKREETADAATPPPTPAQPAPASA